jgi:hypothetical protein
MRKLLYILLILLTVHSSYAQKIRFTDTTNEWTYCNIGTSPTNPPYNYVTISSFKGDTVVNTIQYKKTNFGLVREDTVNKKVYIKNLVYNYSSVDTNERILYDYNLQVGDTIANSYTYKSFKHYVKEIDSTQINSVWYKVWNIVAVSGTSSFSWYSIIEGIGSTKGPWFSVYPYEFENVRYLTCFNNNHSTPIVNPKVSSFFDNATSCKLSVPSTNKQSQSITIIPNPANENSKIVFPYAIQQGRLVVTNAMGQVVLQKDFQNKEQITLGGLPAEGLYFYTVIDKLRNNSYKGKFVYQ